MVTATTTTTTTFGIYESLFVKKLRDNHTHRRTHTQDKHNKNSRN